MVDAMRRRKIRAKKSLGQNFLVNDSIADRIVESVGITDDSLVVEIGAGTGILTRRLMERAHKVVAVEIDSGLVELLRRDLGSESNLTLLNEDILGLDLSRLSSQFESKRMRVIGNIPYNITGPVIERLLHFRDSIETVVMMTQEEVGLRLSAEPGNKIYGALTAIVGYAYKVERLFRVSPANFRPQPSIQSTVLRMVPYREPPVEVCDDALLIRVIKASFQHRRKMLHHAVNRILPGSAQTVMQGSGIDLSRRAETLSLAEFATLTDTLRNSGLQ